MRIGIDLGGTKIEGLALGDSGEELHRIRLVTPRNYAGTLDALGSLVAQLEEAAGVEGSVGMGIPGTISTHTGLVKNANSTWLNGMPLQADLRSRLGREVRLANDANCLAVSEATDGAAAGKSVVFAVILGTGCGGGVAVNGRVHSGANGVGGEWGHNPLPWPGPGELHGPPCYCGKRGCMETWVSGTGVANDFREHTGRALTTREIVRSAAGGDREAAGAIERFVDRLARGLAAVVHTLDPDVIVLGGGLSQVGQIYEVLPGKVQGHIFGGEFNTPILPARFGDASGVRGAAWLWPAAGESSTPPAHDAVVGMPGRPY